MTLGVCCWLTDKSTIIEAGQKCVGIQLGKNKSTVTLLRPVEVVKIDLVTYGHSKSRLSYMPCLATFIP